MKKTFFAQITALLLVLLALFPQPAQAVCAFGSEPPVLQGEIIDIGPIHFDSFFQYDKCIARCWYCRKVLSRHDKRHGDANL
jgi:hypothetical protein